MAAMESPKRQAKRACEIVLITVAAGRLEYEIEADAETGRAAEMHILSPGADGVVEPGVRHRVRPLGPVRFDVRFFR